MHSDKDKLVGVEIFYENGVPFLKECAAYMVCEIIKDVKNESEFDLFKAKVVAAYADTRVFKDGHWKFESLDDDFKTPHYVAGGQFYTDGAAKFEEKAAIIG
ncbi:flavin reductase family protein [Campylobacter concisus]|jgi:flavin reductase domain protein